MKENDNMKEVNKEQFLKHGKKIIFRDTLRGWTIVIMPDEIRIDTYNKPAHIHTKNKGIHIPIKYKDYGEVGLIVELHIERNKCVKLEELMGELL